jgi:hypothetical protein
MITHIVALCICICILVFVVHSFRKSAPIPKKPTVLTFSSGSNQQAKNAGRIYYSGVTHEQILSAMDPNIVAYVDPSMPEFRCEYSRTKARLMGKSDQLEEKNARKAENLRSQISELEKSIQNLKNKPMIAFDQAIGNGHRKSDLCKFFKSKMSGGGDRCLSRSDFHECYLKPFLRKRHNEDTENQINIKVLILQREIDERFKFCIKSFETKLHYKKSELKNYES